MAQYRAVIKGSRGEASRLGHKSSGIEANVNAWDIGIQVTGQFDPQRGDVFEIYLTGGSHAHREAKLLGIFSASDLEQLNRVDGERKFAEVLR